MKEFEYSINNARGIEIDCGWVRAKDAFHAVNLVRDRYHDGLEIEIFYNDKSVFTFQAMGVNP